MSRFAKHVPAARRPAQRACFAWDDTWRRPRTVEATSDDRALLPPSPAAAARSSLGRALDRPDQRVTAPPTAPTPPPISAPVAGLPPVSAETPAPAPAPSSPPVTARVPVVSPHAANPSKAPNNSVNVVVRIVSSTCIALHGVAMHNRPSSSQVSPKQDEKAAIAGQSMKHRPSKLL
jgi:hypothetical protein